MLPVTAEVYSQRTKNKTVSKKFSHCSCHSLCKGLIVCLFYKATTNQREKYKYQADMIMMRTRLERGKANMSVIFAVSPVIMAYVKES